MYFYLIGIDYKTAPIHAREALYRKRKELDEFLFRRNFKGGKILCTCNRIEVYGIVKDLFEARVSIAIFRREFPEFSGYGYMRWGRRDVFRHLLRLASGLESQIKGEPQILGQLEAWLSKGRFSILLYELVHKAILSAKNIRVKSGLGRINNNIAAFVSKDLLGHFKDHERLEVIIVGTGKVPELFTVSGHPQLRLNFAGHKNYLKAQELAKRSEGTAFGLKELRGKLFGIDALISATSSPHFLFDRDFFLRAVSGRKKPLYLYDLAMPRDIDPNAGSLPGIILNNLDTMTGVINEHNESQRVNIILAEGMIEEIVHRCEEEFYEDGFKDGDAAQPLSYKTG